MSRSIRVTKAVAVASLFGAATIVAPAVNAAQEPSMTITLDATVTGKTVDVAYKDSGVQYYANDGRKAMSRYGAMAFFVDYGDDSDPDGYDGRPGLTCETTGPTSPFRDSVSSGYSHTYRKAGTYTITATGYYCGEGGLQTVEKTTTVNIAKPAPAPKVSAAAHIEYTVDGLTATLVPSVTGTQHEMKYGRNKHAKYGVPLVYTMSFPEGAEVSGGATKGGIKRATCTKHGSVEFDPVMLSGDPVVVTFPKPGTYEVTLSADVCTSQRIVSKTVSIVVPPTDPTPTDPTPKPTEPTPTPTTPVPTTPAPTTPAPTTPAPTTPVPTTPAPTTPAPTTPAPTTPVPTTPVPTTPVPTTPVPTTPTTNTTVPTTTTSTTAATTPGTGPKVETDRMGDDTNALSLGVAGLVGAGALGGIVVARRRLQQ